MTSFTIVVPTLARSSLDTLLRALAASEGPKPKRLVLVDDRPRPEHLQLPELPFATGSLRSYGRGPAAARNLGWRAADTEWVVFLDDDVIPTGDWLEDLASDLDGLGGDEAASQARIEVPLPADREPTDAERQTANLAGAKWITADMAYRREVLQAVSGFDERFTRAFREDADLALRVVDAGWRIAYGKRVTQHPARGRHFLSSVRDQAGNADNALMRAKHGYTWRQRSDEGPAKFGSYLLTCALGAAAIAGARRGRRWAALAAGAWAARTAQFAVERITPGPRTAREIADMALSSALIPPAAVGWSLIGLVRHRPTLRPGAILFDRDDTLVVDVPYQTDPDKVRPMPGAELALSRLRASQVPVGVVTNQSGVGKGLISGEQLDAVNARVEALLGPFGTWQVCPHRPEDRCPCRKPSPEMVRKAAAELGARPRHCVMIGDTGADVAAALNAGAKAILVPTKRTLPDEIAMARRRATVARDLCEAVNIALGDVP
ncbi:HAD-IIIA family hydrolase [Glycomyces halotolerans]